MPALFTMMLGRTLIWINRWAPARQGREFENGAALFAAPGRTTIRPAAALGTDHRPGDRGEDTGAPSPTRSRTTRTTMPAASSPRPTATSARRGSGRRPLTEPAIVTPISKAASASVPRGVKPGNDNRSVEQPAAIVTAKKPRGRKAAWTDDGAETPESVKAFLARMVRPGGPLPPTRGMTAGRSQAPLAQLRHRAATDRQGSPGGAVPGVPVVVHGEHRAPRILTQPIPPRH